MRVLLDANIFISYLLSDLSHAIIPQIVKTCILSPRIQLVAPQLLLEEVITSCDQKEHLRRRIAPERIRQFTQQLAAVSLVSDEEHNPDPCTRDQKDDYLVYAALVHQVEYLVSGDADLLVLGQVKDVQILTPVMFYKELKRPGWCDLSSGGFLTARVPLPLKPLHLPLSDQ